MICQNFIIDIVAQMFLVISLVAALNAASRVTFAVFCSVFGVCLIYIILDSHINHVF